MPLGGYRDPIETAREKVNWILGNHYPQELDVGQQKALRGILENATLAFE
jgi:hypothetical protein